jgi:hypothetical protein
VDEFIACQTQINAEQVGCHMFAVCHGNRMHFAQNTFTHPEVFWNCCNNMLKLPVLMLCAKVSNTGPDQLEDSCSHFPTLF